jgi:hypothetical protein
MIGSVLLRHQIQNNIKFNKELPLRLRLVLNFRASCRSNIVTSVGMFHANNALSKQQRAIITMTDTDMAQMPVARAQKLVRSDYLQDVVWPVMGLGFALLCTVAWCAFLGWQLINLLA